MTDRLASALGRGLVVLDAAMGTRLLARGLRLDGDDPALWNCDRPEAVAEVHRLDVEAGADALLTNTFGANRAWLARFGRSDEVEAINRQGVGLARREAGPGRLVLGSIGPTAVQAPGACLEQARILVDAGVDTLLLETHQAEQAEAALREIGGLVPIRLLVSLVAWPASPADLARRLADLGATALGGNCQAGIEPALRLAEALRRVTDLPLIVKPAAGLPGGPLAGPESFASAVPELLGLRPVLVGGCCGTTEAHVAALRAACYDCGAAMTNDE